MGQPQVGDVGRLTVSQRAGSLEVSALDSPDVHADADQLVDFTG
jgi:hypothetical protein